MSALSVNDIWAPPTYSAVSSIGAGIAGINMGLVSAQVLTAKLVRITIRGDATAAAQITVSLARYSNPINTGGTATGVPGISHDGRNTASSATLSNYTVAPAGGTLVGTIRQELLQIGAAGLQAIPVIWTFPQSFEKAPLLRPWQTSPNPIGGQSAANSPVADQYCLVLSAGAGAGGAVFCEWTWTEDNPA
jgi:hypothetical protein